MFAVHFYASCFDRRGNLIGKKNLWLDWEKAVYRPLFALANTLAIINFHLKVFWIISAWYSVFSLKHFSCKEQSVLLTQLHVILLLLTGGWRIFLLWVDGWFNVWHTTLIDFYIFSFENFVEFVLSRKVLLY